MSLARIHALKTPDEAPRTLPFTSAEIDTAAALFKALGHDGRLAILCLIAEGEKSVSELETLLGQRQAAVSQQLARLRLEGLVETRREGKSIYYSLHDQRIGVILPLIGQLAAQRRA